MLRAGRFDLLEHLDISYGDFYEPEDVEEYPTDEGVGTFMEAVKDIGLPMLSAFFATYMFHDLSSACEVALVSALITNCPRLKAMYLRGREDSIEEAVAAMARAADCRYRLKYTV